MASSRRWLVVIEDTHGQLDPEEAAAAYITAIIDDPGEGIKVLRVQRGGLLAQKIMDELPPMRRGESDRMRRPARLAD